MNDSRDRARSAVLFFRSRRRRAVPVARRLRLLLGCSPALAASPPLKRSGRRRLRLSLSPALARSLGFASLAAPPRSASPRSARAPSLLRGLSVSDRRRAQRSRRRCSVPRVRCVRVVLRRAINRRRCFALAPPPRFPPAARQLPRCPPFRASPQRLRR